LDTAWNADLRCSCIGRSSPVSHRPCALDPALPHRQARRPAIRRPTAADYLPADRSVIPAAWPGMTQRDEQSMLQCSNPHISPIPRSPGGLRCYCSQRAYHPYQRSRPILAVPPHDLVTEAAFLVDERACPMILGTRPVPMALAATPQMSFILLSVRRFERDGILEISQTSIITGGEVGKLGFTSWRTRSDENFVADLAGELGGRGRAE
jgi:hypothetical protein